MRVRKAVLAAFPALVLGALLVLAASSCGPTPLQKAYPVYDQAAEQVLDRDIPMWKRTEQLFNEQIKDETANVERFEEHLTKQAAPTYDKLLAQAKELKPGDPALDGAQAGLVKYIEARVSFVRYLIQNLEVFRPGASAEALSTRQAEAAARVDAYQDALKGDPPDNRFGELQAIEREYAERVMKPFTEGRMTEDEVQDYVRKRLLVRVQALRSGKFGDDTPSQYLHKAIVAAGDFYTAFADNLPLLDRNARFGAEVQRRRKEAEDLYKAFREEMASVRRRM